MELPVRGRVNLLNNSFAQPVTKGRGLCYRKYDHQKCDYSYTKINERIYDSAVERPFYFFSSSEKH
jgi:hypothetical protein